MAKMVETVWGKVRVDYNDPAHRAGPKHAVTYTLDLIGWRPEVAWKVEGWNDMPKGGACSYENDRTEEGAIYRAEQYARHGDRRPTLEGEPGRRYDHYTVTKVTTVRDAAAGNATITTEVVRRIEATDD